MGESGEKFVVYRLGESLDEINRQIFELVLENNSYNRTKTAKALGVGTRTVRLWIRKFGL